MQRVSGRRLRKAYTDEDGMAIEEFRECGEQIIDLIRDYIEHINLLKARSDKKPFYLQPLMPDHAPEKPDDWDSIMSDFEDHILPGVNHVNHPCCFSYTPAANSYPAILGDMLSSSIACHNFSWFSSPAATELEMVALDWYAKAINLPKTFFHSFTRSKGGGCIQMCLLLPGRHSLETHFCFLHSFYSIYTCHKVLISDKEFEKQIN
ncbi:aromatic-L-amino-acid decarboxylase-like [Schistocerca nitens]|uniref:aromatic-L-amino-acid decarboxylase-like n=1 Tax=Schistocerca nitens TaxID=7011 RepID=UPI002118F78F|nr:aromatic-L-amino-acid decarboxylase-like [Schistocerca nitens]